MLMRGFFRKKNTKVYLIIFIVIISMLTCLYGFSMYIKSLINMNFIETSMLYVESEKNYYNELKNNKYLKNIQRVITAENLYILNIPSITIEEYEINKIIVYPDSKENKDLNEDEAILVLNEINYINYEKKFDEIINSEIMFKSRDVDLNLKIKNIEKNKRRNSIIISSKLFEKLLDNNNYEFVANIKNYDKVTDILKSFLGKENCNIAFIDDSLSKDSNSRDKLKLEMKYIIVSIYIFSAIFFLMIIIANNNIINDLKENIALEYILGFNNIKIIKNILCRLLIMHFVTIVFSLLVYLIIKIIVNALMSIDITINYFIFVIAIVFIVCDLLLVIVSYKHCICDKHSR